jgi:hypothetical protein
MPGAKILCQHSSSFSFSLFCLINNQYYLSNYQSSLTELPEIRVELPHDALKG